MSMKVADLFPTGQSTKVEDVSLDFIAGATRGVGSTAKAVMRSLMPLSRIGYVKLAPVADLVSAGVHFVRGAAGVAAGYSGMSVGEFMWIDAGLTATALGANINARTMTNRAAANELGRTGNIGLMATSAALMAGLCGIFNGSPGEALMLGAAVHFGAAVADIGFATHDRSVKQLHEPPSKVYDVDTLGAAIIEAHPAAFGFGYVTIKDSRPDGEKSYGTLTIGRHHHDHSYRGASTFLQAAELEHVRDTALKIIPTLADEPKRRAEFQAVVDSCNAALPDQKETTPRHSWLSGLFHRSR